MKSFFVLVLAVICTSCITNGENEIVDRLEEVIRELEHVERRESKAPTIESTGVLESVQEADEMQAIRRLVGHITHDRKDVRSQKQQSSSINNERRGSNSGRPGHCYDIDALQRTSTQVLHRINKNNQNNNNNGERKKRSTSCYVERACDSSDDKYRSADGSCNNIANPNWGRAGIPLIRFTTNAYEDSKSLPRTTGVGGGDLPLARKVSTKVHRDDTVNDFTVSGLTHLIMQWGQFLAHDYVSTPTQTDSEGESPTCCVEDLSDSLASVVTQEDLNADPQCLPILIPDGDHYFTTRKCMSLVRSVQADSLDCQADYKEQLNAISTFIDASNVYGSTDDYTKSLRTESQGMLLTSDNDLLPHDVDGLNCVKDTSDDVCFKAGDLRVNVQPGLASMHTLFVRQHNKIASYLSTNNPSWTSDETFLETRKIIGALMQHVTYGEWLPIILGDEIANHDIEPTSTGFNTVYDTSVDPRITTEFATAAGRFGHSMIQSTMTRSFGDFSEATAMSDLYGRAKYVTEENGAGFDRLVNGLINDVPERADDWYSTEVTDKLFDAGNEDSLDIAALNIQRGRDHGIPSYNDMREFCGLSRAERFDIEEGGFVDHRSGIVNRFSQLYASPDDVDLYSGGVSESRVNKGQIGPLFACLNGKQFEALKKGDRFWYENENSDSGFTLDQLNAIKKVTLSRIICDNTNISTIQKIAFAQILNRNQEVSCDDEQRLPKLDLTPWIA